MPGASPYPDCCKASWWSRPLRVSELERDSPYNTRLNRGLPPTPIGNPGLASIKAAAAPARTDYIFYVAKPGACHAFSSTDAEFARDEERSRRRRHQRTHQLGCDLDIAEREQGHER